uniref:Uncharacterized protein n=1 Tax=Cyanothece sp. (strain PCC 7425 / ATCC 29141) TaxID=395961 RepID=B8HT28_CYAP4
MVSGLAIVVLMGASIEKLVLKTKLALRMGTFKPE